MTLLAISQAHKVFGDNHVLRGVDFDVAESEVAVLIGASGSGKSTLLRCINGLELLDSGSITLKGEALPQKPAELRQWREHIGFVFQAFNLFPHLTARQNIALPLRLVKSLDEDDALEVASQLLGTVGLTDKADHFPDQLSGGQQQRVAIARAVGLDPVLMLFDEPTSALDPELTGEVMEVILDLATKGMTMVVVSHELRFVRRLADVVHFMHAGSILESGSPDNIFTDASSPECRRFLSSISD